MAALEEYQKLRQKYIYLEHAYNVLYWDMETMAPVKGKDKIADSLTYFSTEMFKLTTSDEYYELVEKLNEPEEYEKLSDALQYQVKKELRDLEKARRVPADFYEQHMRTVNESAVCWPKAKQDNDWGMYEKPLADTIESMKKYVGYMEPEKPAYDTLIDMFEEGMTQEEIDRVFGELKAELLPLLDRILAAPQPDHSKFTMKIPAHEQAALCRFLSEYVGMDMEAFAQATTEHPFSMSMSGRDVRVTNHYYENEVISAIFSAIHETGHALFELGIDPKYEDTLGARVDYMGLHESQSRFYENILGRNINFWKPIWPQVVEICPELKTVTLEEFYREINHVQNSLIRTEADELTYCLHIIIRYEMERAIFIEGVPVEELPALWNKKYEEYLHIAPATDAEGILQDTHWSDGSFGYFPSYLLGSIYDGMFLEALEAELGPVDDILAAGDIEKITAWLRENIHQYGATRISSEVLQQVCGKRLSAEALIKYFKNKYEKVYNLK